MIRKALIDVVQIHRRNDSYRYLAFDIDWIVNTMTEQPAVLRSQPLPQLSPVDPLIARPVCS